MKILVIDDSVKNQEAAKRQLADHELTVVGSYDEGSRAVDSHRNQYDAVLVDLLMPASDSCQGRDGQKFVGQEMPIGIFLVLSAILNGKVKYVGLLTDMSHHDHPASACLDSLNSGGWYEGQRPHHINGSKVVLSNDRSLVVNGEKTGKDFWTISLSVMINPIIHAHMAIYRGGEKIGKRVDSNSLATLIKIMKWFVILTGLFF